MTRHFLRDDDLSVAEQAAVLDLAARLKHAPYDVQALAGPQAVALIFDKPTLRTQVSFSAGIAEMGGYPMLVHGALAGIGTRESVADTARVLGRQASAIVWRTFAQERIEEMAALSGVSVVNALTDDFHPCQALADLLTIRERLGRTAGLTWTFLGDAACNVAHSTLLAGALAGMHVRVSGPEGYRADKAVLERAAELAELTGGSVADLADPVEAVTGADAVATDTWVSMGREQETEARGSVFEAWRLDDALLDHAADHAIAMHCLPAYRGKEISAEVLDGPRSAAWDQAENRRHVQKAVLAHLLDPAAGASA